MPKEQTTTATVREDGTLLGETAGESLIQWIADTLQLFADGRVEFVIRRPTRSLRQNRRYWAMLTQIAEGFRRAGVEQWHIMGPGGEMLRLPVNKDTLHAWFKRKYIPPDEDGKVTTTTLDETEMHDYMERIKHDEDVRKLDMAFRDRDQIHA